MAGLGYFIYNHLQEMIGRFSDFSLCSPTVPSFYCPYYIQIYTLQYQMGKKRKTDRREHSSETIAVIWALHTIGYSTSKISRENGLPKSSITAIIQRARKNPDEPWRRAIQTGRPPKLSERAERRLVRYIAIYPFATLTCLSTPSKSGYQMSVNTVRRYGGLREKRFLLPIWEKRGFGAKTPPKFSSVNLIEAFDTNISPI